MNFPSAKVNNNNISFSLNNRILLKNKFFCNGNCKIYKCKSLYVLLTKIQLTGQCTSHNMNAVHIIVHVLFSDTHSFTLLCKAFLLYLFTFQEPISSINTYLKSYYILQGHNFSHNVLFWELL